MEKRLDSRICAKPALSAAKHHRPPTFHAWILVLSPHCLGQTILYERGGCRSRVSFSSNGGSTELRISTTDTTDLLSISARTRTIFFCGSLSWRRIEITSTVEMLRLHVLQSRRLETCGVSVLCLFLLLTPKLLKP